MRRVLLPDTKRLSNKPPTDLAFRFTFKFCFLQISIIKLIKIRLNLTSGETHFVHVPIEYQFDIKSFQIVQVLFL